jgi:hypothetical protein
VFKRAWLYVGRAEQLPPGGGYFAKNLPGTTGPWDAPDLGSS